MGRYSSLEKITKIRQKMPYQSSIKKNQRRYQFNDYRMKNITLSISTYNNNNNKFFMYNTPQYLYNIYHINIPTFFLYRQTYIIPINFLSMINIYIYLYKQI